MAGVKGRSGGARPNSGPKRRDPAAAWLTGAKRGPKPVSQGSDATVGAVAAPKYLDADEVAIWRELAPFALVERTLTAGTAMAFATLCRNIVILRKLEAAPLTCAGPDHRGMLTRVEAGWVRFRLMPDGKPVVGEEKPQDEWSEFDRPLTVLTGGKA